MLYVLIAVIALVAIYFLFLRKPAPAPFSGGAPAASRVESKKPEPSKTAEPIRPTSPEAKEQPSAPPHFGRAASAFTRWGPYFGATAEAVQARPLFSRRADVDTLRRGLSRSREAGGFFGKLKGLFGGKSEIDENIATSIEEVLLSSDVGVKTTASILDRVKETLGKGEHVDTQKVWGALREEAKRILEVGGRARALELKTKPTLSFSLASMAPARRRPSGSSLRG